ncbi:hypothetical protein FB45DRAFT_801558 [Roridomyces roridus]|uniref:F-box domain-containing protein n=1 Tax=Roridomyces roridus TaxID=1738132 RepID=A0AAD7BBQ8_9AGAR|nr:hypothetical protein FB45DRAFT_801558 [Roridomyces roridus]
MTSQPWPGSLASRRAKLQRDIAWHYDQISALKATLNALNPIDTLPNELLSKIFGFYAFLQGPPFDLKWTRVMLVCRRWHDIAVVEQVLWSYVEDSFYSPGYVERVIVQMKRSGAAPLTVRIMSMDESNIYSYFLLQHAERLRDVDVRGDAVHVIQFMHGLSSHPLSFLRSLSLDPRYKREEVPGDVVTVFPDAVLDGRAPGLTELDISHLTINWGLLRGLTKLSLTQTPDTNQSGTHILSVLESSPALTSLKLGRVLTEQIVHQPHHAVSLPLLESLWVQDEVQFCTPLIQHLVIPPTARIIIYTLGVQTGSDITHLLVLIRKHIRAPGASTIRWLQLEAHGSPSTPPSHLRMAAFSSESVPDALAFDDASLAINAHPTTGLALRQIMSKILKALPVSTITHLDCRSASHLSVTSWKYALALLPALESIYLFVNNGALQLFGALTELTETPKTPSAGFPSSLKHIHLLAYVYKLRDDAEDFVPSVLEALRRLLDARVAAGTPFPLLDIDEGGDGLKMSAVEWEALFEKVGKMRKHGYVFDPPAMRRKREELVRKMEEIAAKEASEEIAGNDS